MRVRGAPGLFDEDSNPNLHSVAPLRVRAADLLQHASAPTSGSEASGSEQSNFAVESAHRSDINQRTNLDGPQRGPTARAQLSLPKQSWRDALATGTWPPTLPRYAWWPLC